MGFFDFLCNIFGIDDEEDFEEKEQQRYKLKKSQITECEKYFYNVLIKHFSNKFDIRPQVPLSSIIEKVKSFNNEYQNELNRIIDFGIFNKNTQTPLLLIEINDNTHTQSKRITRDKKVKSICENAGIKLITFWTKYDNKENYIVSRINKELNSL